MTTKQLEVVFAAVQTAFNGLSDSEVAQLVMEPFAELSQVSLTTAA